MTEAISKGYARSPRPVGSAPALGSRNRTATVRESVPFWLRCRCLQGTAGAHSDRSVTAGSTRVARSMAGAAAASATSNMVMPGAINIKTSVALTPNSSD